LIGCGAGLQTRIAATHETIVNIQRLTSAEGAAFAELMRIYSEAHPASERKSADALARMIERPEYLLLALMEESAVAGFSIAICFSDSEAALLEYMAIDAADRGRGLGQRLFRATAEQPELCERFLLIEVDSDRTSSRDGEDHARRKAFYRRLGCRQIEGLTYLMPRVAAVEPPLMDMLVYRRELPDALDKGQVRVWLDACYAQVYQQPLPNERIAAMLAGLPNPVRLI
jgi:ribosomal protein S18 acetylase RimI-like enzyme